MKKLFCILFAVALSEVLWAGITVRTPSQGRIWQSARSVTPLSWHWEPGDTKAELVVTSLCERTTAAYVVIRTDGAEYGSQMLDVPSDGREYLYDLVLDIYADENIRTTMTARVCYLPCVTEGKAGVLSTAGKEWKRVGENPRVASYDSSWQEGATSPMRLTYDAGDNGLICVDLEGSSGYVPVDATIPCGDALRGDFALALQFAGEADPWMVALRKYIRGGLLLLFK